MLRQRETEGLPPTGDQGVGVHPRSTVLLKQRKEQGYPSPAHTGQDLLIPLESNLENSPVTPWWGGGSGLRVFRL